MTLFFIALIAGVITILTPCVLPLLPVIVAGSIDHDAQGVSKKRAVVVMLSLGASVILFTILLKVSTLVIMVPQAFWTFLSGGIILALGIVTLFPELWEKIAIIGRLNRTSNQIVGVSLQKKSVWGDVLVGAALGPVFASCSPTYFLILATVLPVQPVLGFLYLLTYTVSLCLALLLVALIGQRLVDRLGVAADPHGRFKRGLGFVFILVGVAILTGTDKSAELFLQNHVFDFTKIEQKLLENNSTPVSSPNISPVNSLITSSTTVINATTSATTTSSIALALNLEKKKKEFSLAPELVHPDGYINTVGKPITLAEFKGKKVVLLDVWTYSCINCERTLPYVTAWYDKYKDQGLEVIGLHTPEFSFEKVQKNVEEAVKRFGITYPVVLDNEYLTWNAYGNQFWPRKYLIDIDGYIVYDHIGEGNYDETETAIQKALAERNAQLGIKATMSHNMATPANAIAFESGKVQSPETYFGSARNQYLANGVQGREGTQMLIIPATIFPGKLYLGGEWGFTPEYAIGGMGSSIIFDYAAKNVYLVASSDASVEIEVLRDGKPIGREAGSDVDPKTSVGTIHDERLYKLIEGGDYGEHHLEIRIKKGTLKAFTFTFG